MGCTGTIRRAVFFFLLLNPLTHLPLPTKENYLVKKKRERERKETVKINEQRPLLDPPTRQEMTRGTKMVSADLFQEPRWQLTPPRFFSIIPSDMFVSVFFPILSRIQRKLQLKYRNHAATH